MQADDRLPGAFIDVVHAKAGNIGEARAERKSAVEGLIRGNYASSCRATFLGGFDARLRAIAIGLDAIAVEVDDIGGVIVLAVFGSDAGLAVRVSSG